jgi:hypothetical protein
MAGTETDLTLSNHYRLLRRVRVGTAGDVWEAQDQRSANRLIDIEIFRDDPRRDPGFLERRRRGIESLLWPWFHHPSAPRILQYGEEESIRFVVLEHLEGETLAERLDRGPMKPANAARMAAEIAEAIQKAHDTGFVHGELRPENILMMREGAAKVLELGFTPAAWEGATFPDSEDQEGADRERPQESTLKPEANEEARRTDLYALGMVLYQVLTGRPPALPSEVGGGEDQPLPVKLVAPWVPSDLADVCEAAVSADPRVRPPTAAAFASVLRRYAAAPITPTKIPDSGPETILVVEGATAPTVQTVEEEIVPPPGESRREVRSSARATRRAARAERAAQKERARADRAAQHEAAEAAKVREQEERAWREAEERLVREEAARRGAEERARVEAEERLVREEAARRGAEERARVEAEQLDAKEAVRLEAERLAVEERDAVEAEERSRLEAAQAGRLEAERRAAEEAARLEAARLEAERHAAKEAARLEAARLEAERHAAEEAARLQAEEHARLKAMERARLEAARLATEMSEELHHEDRRIEAELRAVAVGAVDPVLGRAAQKELRHKAKQIAKADRKAEKERRRKAEK